MANKKTLPKLKKQALELLQLLVRVKSADDNGYCQCVTCPTISKWNDGIQGGHFISRRKTKWCLVEENIHPQCASCNGFGMKYHNKEAVYTIYMQEMYTSEFVQHMIDTQGEVIKLSRFMLEDYIKDFNEQIKFHKQRIGAM
jgi:hypothetical protein